MSPCPDVSVPRCLRALMSPCPYVSVPLPDVSVPLPDVSVLLPGVSVLLPCVSVLLTVFCNVFFTHIYCSSHAILFAPFRAYLPTSKQMCRTSVIYSSLCSSLCFSLK
ncbi:hypothetical protein GDO81_019218 [Engystomops pustulosus]|uniref:Uncharacterized protein n=1 Tax=Engystomops pustulosus TaxID=76066 RepID=A0AAV6YH14_ENGPU|nr:hypothetical protein GDO81_019218 [Engystomops pustulosus]